MRPTPLALALWRTTVVAITAAMTTLVVAAHLFASTPDDPSSDQLAEQPQAEEGIPDQSR